MFIIIPLQYTAVTWISEFAILSGPAILPYTSGILTAILPCMAYDDDSKKGYIFEFLNQPQMGQQKLLYLDLRETTRIVNSNLMRLVDSDSEKNMELGSVVLVLDQHLTHNSVHTKVAVLKWIEHLLSHLPNSVSALFCIFIWYFLVWFYIRCFNKCRFYLIPRNYSRYC